MTNCVLEFSVFVNHSLVVLFTVR